MFSSESQFSKGKAALLLLIPTATVKPDPDLQVRGVQQFSLTGADLAAVAPALHGRLDVMLWDTLAGAETDPKVLVVFNTAACEWSKPCSRQPVTCALGFAPSAFWSQGGSEPTADACKASLVYKSECLTHNVPIKLQSVDVSALFSLFETDFFFSPSSL